MFFFLSQHGYLSEIQHSSGYTSVHQTQHISACRLVPLLLQRGCHRSTWSASGWSLRCSKRIPAPDSQGSRVPRCAVAVFQRAQVQAESLGCKAECGSLFTRLGETATAIAGGQDGKGRGCQRLLLLQFCLCRRTRMSGLIMTIIRPSPAVLQERILKMFSEHD